MSRKDASHKRIVKAAVALFSRQSYRGTSMREIARLADVNELTVFRHFVSKEAIFHAALDASLSSVTSRLGALDPPAIDVSPEIMLRQIVGMFVDIAEFSPEVVRLTVIAMLEGNEKTRELCRKHLAPLFSRINAYLEAQCRSGRLKTANSSIATAAMMLSILAQPELSRFVNEVGPFKKGIGEAIQENTRFWIDALGA